MRAGATCVVLAACLGASAVALSHEQEQVVFMDNGITNDVGQGQRLPLVSSEALEGAITANKLMARARKLYEIAQESREEYGRPTRVIGSKGRSSVYMRRGPYSRAASALLGEMLAKRRNGL